MGRLLIVEPMPIVTGATRGTGAANLATRDPKEVWVDTDVGNVALTVDLGSVRTIDTIFVGYLRPPAAGAFWTIEGGVNGYTEMPIQFQTPLRVSDVAGSAPATTHALRFGAAVSVRYLAITLNQPAGSPPLSAGVVVVGKAFVAALGQEWGYGRQPIDTGTATSLQSGGFSVVEGARKSLLTWTFGDLSVEEADRLELIGLALGETLPALVVEDADATTGLRSRIHYGLFKRWRAFERRNRRQTRWEIGIEQWV